MSVASGIFIWPRVAASGVTSACIREVSVYPQFSILCMLLCSRQENFGNFRFAQMEVGSPILLLIGWNFRHLKKPLFLAVGIVCLETKT